MYHRRRRMRTHTHAMRLQGEHPPKISHWLHARGEILNGTSLDPFTPLSTYLSLSLSVSLYLSLCLYLSIYLSIYLSVSLSLHLSLSVSLVVRSEEHTSELQSH